MSWGEIVGWVAGSAIISTGVTHLLARSGAAADARRAGYMEASRVVVARYEYPYRIKRRLSDEVTEKGPLIALGHELQERQAASRLWVRSDSTWVADVYEAVLGKLDESFGDSCRDAWATAVDESGEVESLDGWGPGSPTKQLHTFEHAVSWRFGWRRFVPSLLCKRLVAAGADTH